VVTSGTSLYGYSAGQKFAFEMIGCLPAGYNGYFTGTVVNSNTFTYPLATNPGTTTGLGAAEIAGASYGPSNVVYAYAAPNVSDGTAIWAFGTSYVGYFSTGINIAGTGWVGVPFAATSSVYNSCFDASAATLGANASALALAQNMYIDFTANGTAAGKMLHTLGYDTFYNALAYLVSGVPVWLAYDTGNFTTKYNVVDDGSGNASVALHLSVGGALSVVGTVSGTGITSLFASPPAIGGTAAAAGKFTTLSTTNNTLDDGSGNITATGNISAGASGVISAAQYVGHSAGSVQFGPASFTANGSTSLSLTALGPSGAHATVQEWLTIKDSGGTTRYIPCF
jgi:hypothetical protein